MRENLGEKSYELMPHTDGIYILTILYHTINV